MAKFFKTFAKGILYIIILPLLIIFLAVYFVISLLSFIFLSIQGIFLFFRGENLVGEMYEDKLAKQRLDALAGATNNNPTNVGVNQNQINTPIAATPTMMNQNVAPTPSYPQNNEAYEPPFQEEEILFLMPTINEAEIEHEENILVEETFELEPEPEEEIMPSAFVEKEEEINVSHSPTRDREYIVEEHPLIKNDTSGVDFFDYEDKEEE